MSTKQFDLSTGSSISVNRGDSIHFHTDTGLPDVTVQFTNSPFTDGLTNFTVNANGPTKTVSTTATTTSYPMTLTPAGGNGQSGSVTVDSAKKL